MTATEQDPPRLEDFETEERVAEFLGISETSLRRYRDLPRVELPGGRRLYYRQSVAGWLRKRETR